MNPNSSIVAAINLEGNCYAKISYKDTDSVRDRIGRNRIGKRLALSSGISRWWE